MAGLIEVREETANGQNCLFFQVQCSTDFWHIIYFSESENKWVIGTDNANLSQQLILEQTDSAIQASLSHTSLTHLSSNAWNMCMIDTVLHGNITTRSWTRSPN